MWCKDNNLSLNVSKTKELIVNYRKRRGEHAPIYIDKASQLFPLRRLKRFAIGPQIFKKFYSFTIESILTGCITAWYGKCKAQDRKALKRVVSTAQYITGTKLPVIRTPFKRLQPLKQ